MNDSGKKNTTKKQNIQEARGRKDLGSRVLGKDISFSNDTFQTGINNNVMIVGPSGAGKTTGFISPNISCAAGSMIIADTKGSLYKKHQKDLEKRGYDVFLLDFIEENQSCAYNPLDFIRYDEKTDRFSDKDILALVSVLLPLPPHEREPIWIQTAQVMLSSIIGFVMECLPPEERHMGSVVQLFKAWDPDTYQELFTALENMDPDSFAAGRYRLFKNMDRAEKFFESCRQFVATALAGIDYDGGRKIFSRLSSFTFEQIGSRKTALFLNISDSDRSLDSLVNLFYSQALHELIRIADKNPDGRLKVPVQIYFDDFATNTVIPDFDKLISVVRSREISLNIVVQSLTQLEALYTWAQAQTIINNCDTLIYLGGNDVHTAEYIACKTNTPSSKILAMGLDQEYLFIRGQGCRVIEKCEPEF